MFGSHENDSGKILQDDYTSILHSEKTGKKVGTLNIRSDKIQGDNSDVKMKIEVRKLLP